MIVVEAESDGVHWLVERPGVARVLLAEQFPQQLIAVLQRLTQLPLRLGVVQPVGLLDGGSGLPPGPDTLDSLRGQAGGGHARHLLNLPLGPLQGEIC